MRSKEDAIGGIAKNLRELARGEALTTLKDELSKNVLLGRLGDPDEIAEVVAFLASDEASYISGI